MSTYVVYHKTSTEIIRYFDTASAAKRSAACSNRNAGRDSYAWAEYTDYSTFVLHKKTVKNLMTGQDVVIDSNTPRSCDPSGELFWTM